MRSGLALLLLAFGLGCSDSGSASPSEPAFSSTKAEKLASLPGLALKHLSPPSGDEDLHLIVGGHLYGAPGEDAPRPAASFLRHRARWAERGAHLFVSLGDMIDPRQADALTPMRRLMQEAALPCVNAVGNHDLAPSADAWRSQVGATWFDFDLGALRGIVLDTESDLGQISGEQLEFLSGRLRDLPDTCRVVALFMHKPLFADRPETAPLALAGNDLPAQRLLFKRFPDGPPFSTSIRPLLESIAKERKVLLFAGDIGAFPNRWGLFHHREADTGIECFGCGLGDTDRDALLDLRVTSEGEVKVSVIPLGSASPRDLSERNAEAWRAQFFPQGLPAEVRDYLSRNR
jgi:hypothetical protein